MKVLEGFSKYTREGDPRKYNLVTVTYTQSYNNKNKVWVEDIDKQLDHINLSNKDFYKLALKKGEWLAIDGKLVRKVKLEELDSFKEIGRSMSDQLDYIVAFKDDEVLASTLARIRLTPSKVVSKTFRGDIAGILDVNELLDRGRYYLVYLSVNKPILSELMASYKDHAVTYDADVYLISLVDDSVVKM